MTVNRHRVSGFTLIELMIVVLIIAILTMIAIPSYEKHVTDSKVDQAKSNLTLLSTLLERYYQDNNAYPATGAVPTTLNGWAPGNHSLFTYTIANPGPGGAAYQITATSITGNGIDGYSLTLDSNNNQGETLPGGQTVAPWQ